MRIHRGICAFFVVVPLMISGCTGGSGSKGTLSPSSASPTSATTKIPASSSATTTTAVKSALPSSNGTVPVDQIPPGHPTHWVPAGMPTTAKYKEPGDFFPMFTPALLKNDPYAPSGMVGFVVSTLNWSEATGIFPQILSTVCQSELCDSAATVLRKQAANGQHVVGARVRILSTATRRGLGGSGVSWIVRAHLRTADGKVVNRSGSTVRTIVTDSLAIDFYMKWTGKIWRVSRDALVAIK